LNSGIFILLAILFAGTGALLTSAYGQSSGAAILADTTNQALQNIRNAEAAGADVSDLVARFNSAVQLQDQATSGRFVDCKSYDECIINSNNILLSVVEDSSSLANKTTADNDQANMMTFAVYVPVASFVLSLAIVVMFKLWKTRRAKRYQGMDIHRTGVH
jgi:hypothetical protein